MHRLRKYKPHPDRLERRCHGEVAWVTAVESIAYFRLLWWLVLCSTSSRAARKRVTSFEPTENYILIANM